jgi:hypothetical protein
MVMGEKREVIIFLLIKRVKINIQGHQNLTSKQIITIFYPAEKEI